MLLGNCIIVIHNKHLYRTTLWEFNNGTKFKARPVVQLLINRKTRRQCYQHEQTQWITARVSLFYIGNLSKTYTGKNVDST